MSIIKGSGEDKFPPSFKKTTRSPLIKKDEIDILSLKEELFKENVKQDEIVVVPSSEEEARTFQHASKEEEIEIPSVDAQTVLDNARGQASRMIKEAEANAEKLNLESQRLIKESQLYCQSAYSQSERDGYNIGKEEGFKKGQEEVARHIEEAKDIKEQAIREREILIHGAEPEIANLSIEIARKIVGKELLLDRGAIAGIVEAAMSKIKGARESVTIRVNPQDYEEVLKNKDVYGRMVEGLKNLEIASDNKLEPGDCLIETNLGNVDARIKTQLETLRIAFKEVEEYDREELEGS